MHRFGRRFGRHARGGGGPGFGPGPGPGFGPFPPHGRFFGPGELRLAILALLDEAPGHGYELMTRLEQKCGGAYRASAGAIYPTLQQLEDEDLVRVKSENGKKTYEITAAGKKELDAHKDDVEWIWSRAETRSEWGVFRDPEAAEIIGPALRLAKTALRTIVRAHGDPDVVERVREIFEDARAEIARIERRRRR